MMFDFLDLRTKKLLLLLLSLLFCWWLFTASATCSASEPTYQITETELVQLENNLARLKTINTQLQLESSTQKEQSAILLKQVTLLQDQLRMLREQSLKQEELLTIANRSLEEFATEEKKKRLKIKAQRNTYFALMVAATAFAVCHR